MLPRSKMDACQRILVAKPIANTIACFRQFIYPIGQDLGYVNSVNFSLYYYRKSLLRLSKSVNDVKVFSRKRRRKLQKCRHFHFLLEMCPVPPRYDLNELRHHQRRCAALLFGTRKRGPPWTANVGEWYFVCVEFLCTLSTRGYFSSLCLDLAEAAKERELEWVDTYCTVTSHIYKPTENFER